MDERTVWSTNAMEIRATEVIRVPCALGDHLPRISVDWVMGIDEPDVRQRQQRGDVGVVHEEG